tara:strand:- start:301 stop:531 length:231 start_codon:yes stop_codon:yes gene_type:complete
MLKTELEAELSSAQDLILAQHKEITELKKDNSKIAPMSDAAQIAYLKAMVGQLERTLQPYLASENEEDSAEISDPE